MEAGSPSREHPPRLCRVSRCHVRAGKRGGEGSGIGRKSCRSSVAAPHHSVTADSACGWVRGVPLARTAARPRVRTRDSPPAEPPPPLGPPGPSSAAPPPLSPLVRTVAFRHTAHTSPRQQHIAFVVCIQDTTLYANTHRHMHSLARKPQRLKLKEQRARAYIHISTNKL